MLRMYWPPTMHLAWVSHNLPWRVPAQGSTHKPYGEANADDTSEMEYGERFLVVWCVVQMMICIVKLY